MCLAIRSGVGGDYERDSPTIQAQAPSPALAAFPPKAPAIRLMMMLDKLTTPASSVLMPRVVAKDREKLGVSCERAVAKAREPGWIV